MIVGFLVGDDPLQLIVRSGTWRSTAARRVAWQTLESLEGGWSVVTAPTTASPRAISRLIRADMVIVDDVGMLPVSAEGTEALFRLVDAAYGRRSLALTSNLNPSGFDELVPKTLAAATVDRLLHHAHVIVTEGTESHRLTQASAGQGVVSLG